MHSCGIFSSCLGKNIQKFKAASSLKQGDNTLPTHICLEMITTYCWWNKSCTTWDVWNHVNNGILTISTGAGFHPSTVSLLLDYWLLCFDYQPDHWHPGMVLQIQWWFAWCPTSFVSWNGKGPCCKRGSVFFICQSLFKGPITNKHPPTIKLLLPNVIKNNSTIIIKDLWCSFHVSRNFKSHADIYDESCHSTSDRIPVQREQVRKSWKQSLFHRSKLTVS